MLASKYTEELGRIKQDAQLSRCRIKRGPLYTVILVHPSQSHAHSISITTVILQVHNIMLHYKTLSSIMVVVLSTVVEYL